MRVSSGSDQAGDALGNCGRVAGRQKDPHLQGIKYVKPPVGELRLAALPSGGGELGGDC